VRPYLSAAIEIAAKSRFIGGRPAGRRWCCPATSARGRSPAACVRLVERSAGRIWRPCGGGDRCVLCVGGPRHVHRRNARPSHGLAKEGRAIGRQSTERFCWRNRRRATHGVGYSNSSLPLGLSARKQIQRDPAAASRDRRGRSLVLTRRGRGDVLPDNQR
jgi:hypothetical protein